ncbi:MAG: hypothetical protein HYV07_23380 [Deltaproteobacteria bacterium]|nr:hypothetical protein [Deltaproteobacteria bacterium]
MAETTSAERERAALLEWLSLRLADESRRAEWTRLLEASWNAWLDTELSALVPPEVASSLVAAYLEPSRARAGARAGIGGGLARAVGEARRDALPLRDWVPDAAERIFLSIAERPGLVRREWVETIFKEEAIEKIAAEALFRALKDFSAVIPKILKNLPLLRRVPILGGSGGLTGKIIEEVERLLEPEIRSFLSGGTRRALDRASTFAIDHLDDPSSRALRKNVVAFILSKSPAFHVDALSPEILAELDRAAVEISARISESPRSRELAERILRELADAHGHKKLREVLEELGANVAPPFTELSAATWPGMQRALSSSETRAWLDRLLADLLAERARIQSS